MTKKCPYCDHQNDVDEYIETIRGCACAVEHCSEVQDALDHLERELARLTEQNERLHIEKRQAMKRAESWAYRVYALEREWEDR